MPQVPIKAPAVARAGRFDYFMLAGPMGAVQHGIMRWDGDEACFCMAAPGLPRPTEFKTGSGLTLSQWRRV
jgi:hypothetical protein